MPFAIMDSILLKYIPEDGVTEVTVPDGVTSIGGMPLNGYGETSEETLLKWFTSIREKPFKDCTELTGIVLPYSVTSIGSSAFKGCTNLRHIFIPESVTCIGESAFEGCESLKRIYLPDSIRSIGKYAFSGCKSLRRITIPRAVKRIAMCAFDGCESLTEFIVPESVTEIDYGAFKNCRNLQKITIPESVTEISGCILDNTPWMEQRTEDLIIINHVLIRYQGQNPALVIPEDVTSVAENTVPDCGGMESITIPESVKAIYKSAFKHCMQLRSLTLYGITFDPSEMKDYDLYDAMEMLREGDFSAEVRPCVKYAAITGYYLNTNAPAAAAYIREHAPEVFRFLIDSRNLNVVGILLDRRLIVHREDIDELIAHVIETDCVDLRIRLLHYKSEVLGYGDPAEMFEL